MHFISRQSSNQSSQRPQNTNRTKTELSANLKMDETNFEPTSNVTRHEYQRKQLTEQFAKILQRKMNAPAISDEKHLQGSKITNNQASASASKPSFWSEYAHPVRGFRRTSDFTKPDSEYLGTSQWR